MGIFSFLKAPETMGKMLDAVINTGDALVYTAEEKAEMQKKMAEIHLDHIKATAGENNHTSVARRWVSVLIIVPFVFLTLGSALLDAFKMSDVADHWQELAMEDYSNLVMMVCVFYFGPHLAKALKK